MIKKNQRRGGEMQMQYLWCFGLVSGNHTRTKCHLSNSFEELLFLDIGRNLFRIGVQFFDPPNQIHLVV